ncbi:hypothetical protein [Phaeodactylibacter luteus]|uniref:Uncharacterized protein n=1 Tax=Phaeodactylibacter luteus TaxID=1564516 RepID=A0A5C6RHL9_9BACT|nr:hypothetical protein [Phaeodactylibacter luteus]TXB61385.1 hypothetical protein FRY97_19410 [Phaeodactylibacter luteus]
MFAKENLIPGIFNYCDRWCERCRLADRCSIYAEEQSLTDEEKDMSNAAFWQRLGDSIKEAHQMLEAYLKEAGLEDLPEVEPVKPSAQVQALNEQARAYTTATLRWIREEAPLPEGLAGTGERVQAISEGRSVIAWYATMVSAKIFRALRGFDYIKARGGTVAVDSSANGSAKVALLCIDRSLGGWHLIQQYQPWSTDEIIDFQVHLSRLRQGLLSFFPQADAFVRPGFDEITEEME